MNEEQKKLKSQYESRYFDKDMLKPEFLAERCVVLRPENKGYLAKLLFGDKATIDFARPKEFDEEMRANNVNPDMYVWVYDSAAPFGKPLNLAEELMKRQMYGEEQ